MMNSLKNTFAIILTLSIFLLGKEIVDLFHLAGNFFSSDSIITTVILLTTVLFINYKNAPGKLKTPLFNTFLDKVFPALYGVFLVIFLTFLFFQIQADGFAEDNYWGSKVFAVIVALFPLAYLLLFNSKWLHKKD